MFYHSNRKQIRIPEKVCQSGQTEWGGHRNRKRGTLEKERMKKYGEGFKWELVRKRKKR